MLLQRFYRFVQSGFYLDFFFKKVSEVVVRNVYVYSAQFLGEKFIIEVCTKLFIYKILFAFAILFIRALGFRGLILCIFLIAILLIIFINFVFLFDIFMRVLLFILHF